MNKIEKTHERALRYISDDYDSNYQQLLENNTFVSMEVKRKQIFKIFKGSKYLKYLKEANI